MAIYDVGIIMMPHIFGVSKSFREHAKLLQDAGHLVSIIDHYQFHHSPPPFFLTQIIKDEARKLITLASSFDQNRISTQIWETHDWMKRGSRNIAYLGFGLGAEFLLSAAEQHAQFGDSHRPDRILAFYPHLAYDLPSSKKFPNLHKINSPMTLFYGKNDDKISEETKRILAAATEMEHVELRDDLPGGHAFADKYVQRKFRINWRNPLYNSEGTHRAMQRVLWHLQMLKYKTQAA